MRMGRLGNTLHIHSVASYKLLKKNIIEISTSLRYSRPEDLATLQTTPYCWNEGVGGWGQEDITKAKKIRKKHIYNIKE